MVVVTYEEKMNYLEERLEPMKRLLKAWSNIDKKNPVKEEVEESIKKYIDIIECIMEDVRDMHIINEEAEKFNKIEKQAEDMYEELFLK